jgi:hypothetical protein
MVRWSDTGENVLRQLQIIQIRHTYIINSQKKKIKKIELSGPTLLRHFPLKKSDFLGIFKNVLRKFHCIFSSIQFLWPTKCMISETSHVRYRPCQPIPPSFCNLDIIKCTLYFIMQCSALMNVTTQCIYFTQCLLFLNCKNYTWTLTCSRRVLR